MIDIFFNLHLSHIVARWMDIGFVINDSKFPTYGYKIKP